jgi:hypothetical protein
MERDAVKSSVALEQETTPKVTAIAPAKRKFRRMSKPR